MKESNKLTAKRLRGLISYDRHTGLFAWRISGKQIGSLDMYGYLTVRISRRSYKLHRIAWLYVTGKMPSKWIDHVNRNRTDNRFENLRLSSRSENQQNRPKNLNNRSGFKGVSFCRDTKRWRATITAGGQNKSLGRFDTKEQAYAAYQIAARSLHGEFCCV